MLFKEFDIYSENLLLAQYDVSNIIEHELLKGEIREDFLIEILKSRFNPKPNIFKGTLSDGNSQAGQVDLILCKPNRQIYQLGTQAIINPKDCLCLIEVKGNAIGNDLRKYNNKICQIKQMNCQSFPLFGIFCYQLQLTERNIMLRFGYSYDNSTNTYYLDDNLSLEYPEIDFIVCLDTKKSFYIRKDLHTARFIRIYEHPVIKNVFSLIQSLLMTVNI